MGNNTSKGSAGNAAQSPPPSTPVPGSQTAASNAQSERRQPRRRESLVGLTSNRTAKPSANLQSTIAHPTTAQSSSRSAREALRSQTAAVPFFSQPPPPQSSQTPHLRPHTERGEKPEPERPEQRSPLPVSPPSAPQPSQPIAVATTAAAAAAQHAPLSPASTTETPSLLEDETYELPPAQFTRPPRLPLPIEEEMRTPGSPILSPDDVAAPIGPMADDVGLPRRTSVLSSATADDEDLGDDLDYLEGPHKAVPTMIEWRQGGEKVYVTGTFAGWDRKFRLHKGGPSKHKDALSAVINLQPGTHHIRFIVDGDMKLSNTLPTAVDFTNFLVNYIEVSADDLLPHDPTKAVDQTAKPLPALAAQPAPAPPQVELRAPPGVFPPQLLPPTPELIPIVIPPREATPRASATRDSPRTTRPTPVAPTKPKKYHNVIPQFLVDLDESEDSPRFARASAVVSTAPAPPSLPLFLGKSILNGNTPMKDDASVLNMPNHTVLNHLATSSIRNKVLATSATTRYKRKFLTTIMYKPTSTDVQ